MMSDFVNVVKSTKSIENNRADFSNDTHHPDRGVGFNQTTSTGPSFKADSPPTPHYFSNLNRQSRKHINIVSPESIIQVDRYADYARYHIGTGSPVKTDSYTDKGNTNQSEGPVAKGHLTKTPTNFKLDNEGLFKKIVGIYVFVNFFILLSILLIKITSTVGSPF